MLHEGTVRGGEVRAAWVRYSDGGCQGWERDWSPGFGDPDDGGYAQSASGFLDFPAFCHRAVLDNASGAGVDACRPGLLVGVDAVWCPGRAQGEMC